MPAMQWSILWILPLGKKLLDIFPIGLGLNIIFYKAKLVYCLVIDNTVVKRIENIGCFNWEVCQAGSKC